MRANRLSLPPSGREPTKEAEEEEEEVREDEEDVEEAEADSWRRRRLFFGNFPALT